MHRIHISCHALGALFLFATTAFGQTCEPSCGAGESCCEDRCIPSIGFFFEDVTEDRGITATQSSEPDGEIPGPGLAAADFDNDGYIDLFIPQAGGVADLVYRNLGDGTYEEIAAELGLASTASGVAALWIDYNNDKKLDLFVVDMTPGVGASMFRLFRNDYDTVCRTTGTDCFSDVTVASGLFTLGSAGALAGIAAGDVNNDGFVDIYVAPDGPGAFLLVNQGTGTFQNMAAGSGITLNSSNRWQPIMADFNNDGWIDIYQNEDARPNRLWINQKTGPAQPTFLNEIPCYENHLDPCDEPLIAGGGTDMGITLGDIDNDGDLDLYTANWGNNVLLRNDGNVPVPGGVGGAIGVLPDFTNATSLLAGPSHFSWGTTFMDADNDGLVDLAVTNGFAGLGAENDPTVFYHNVPGGPTQFLSVGVGISDTDQGVSFVAFDSDRDGDLDSMQSGNSIADAGLLRLRETIQCNGRNYLVVKPRTFAGNHFGIGAIVRVTTLDGANPQSMMRILTAGTSFYGQEPAEAFFGLDDATLVDITVEWPDDDTLAGQNGTVETTDLVNLDITTIVDPNGYRSLTVCPEPAGPGDDCDGNGILDACDLANGDDFDCNENNTLDSCDIAGGSSNDCNANLIPDECDLANGTSLDCNANSVPDECDIGSGSSLDCNDTGVPDECENLSLLTAEAEGARYIGITPSFATQTPVALRVQGDAANPSVSCLSMFVQADGTLGVTSVFQTPVQWCRVHAHAVEIIPDTNYTVESFDGTVWSSPISVTTWLWGDVNNDALSDFTDISLVIAGFGGDFSDASLEAMDQAPPLFPATCAAPDGMIDFDDVDAAVDAFQSIPYPCPNPPIIGPCGGCSGPQDCDDGVACTIDTCDNFVCFHTPDDGLCPDNGLFCDGDEFCDPGVGCASTGNPCHRFRLCNEFTDTCGLGGPDS